MGGMVKRVKTNNSILIPSPYPTLPCPTWLSLKLDPVNKWPKISSGMYICSVACIATGMPLPSLYTEIRSLGNEVLAALVW